mgnify:CR=1 FL=1
MWVKEINTTKIKVTLFREEEALLFEYLLAKRGINAKREGKEFEIICNKDNYEEVKAFLEEFKKMQERLENDTLLRTILEIAYSALYIASKTRKHLVKKEILNKQQDK